MLEFWGRHASVKGIAAAQNLTLGLSWVQALGKPSQGRFASLRATVENVKSYIYIYIYIYPEYLRAMGTKAIPGQKATKCQLEYHIGIQRGIERRLYISEDHWENYMSRSNHVLLKR